MHILNIWNAEKKRHEFILVEKLPEDAIGDNWIQLDDETFTAYATGDVPTFGRSFALDLWGEHLCKNSDVFDSVWDALHGDISEGDGNEIK